MLYRNSVFKFIFAKIQTAAELALILVKVFMPIVSTKYPEPCDSKKH